MLPSDMNLNIKIGTVGYNNKILVSDGKFDLGKNNKINTLEPAAMKSHKNSKANALEPAAMESHKNSKVIAHSTTTQGLAQKQTITHEEERELLSFSFSLKALLCALCFDEWVITILYTTGIHFSLVQLYGLCFDEWVITKSYQILYTGSTHFSLVQPYGLCFDEQVITIL